MRYFVQFSYCGTAYHGSQTQPNGITVQEVMENAFSTILRQPISLVFAGRTDAGVHAEKMFAHFDYPQSPTTNHQSAINSSTIQRLNSLLPSDISIQGIYPVIDNAHARFDALSRTYEYRVTEVKDPFHQGLVARVPAGLDFAKMNEAAQYLLGRQDFASFCRVHTDVKTTFCTISQASWTPTHQSTISNKQSAINNSPAGAYPCSLFLAPLAPTGRSISNHQSAISNSPAGAYPCSWFLAPLAPTGQSITNQQSPISNSPAGAYPCSLFLAPYSPFQSPITFTITADRFLRNMVRAVVGTLFEVGKGRLSPEQFRDIISQRNRCSAGQSAPAEGLYLVDITYPPHIFRP